jgi:hypothetical protein
MQSSSPNVEDPFVLRNALAGSHRTNLDGSSESRDGAL